MCCNAQNLARQPLQSSVELGQSCGEPKHCNLTAMSTLRFHWPAAPRRRDDLVWHLINEKTSQRDESLTCRMSFSSCMGGHWVSLGVQLGRMFSSLRSAPTRTRVVYDTCLAEDLAPHALSGYRPYASLKYINLSGFLAMSSTSAFSTPACVSSNSAPPTASTTFGSTISKSRMFGRRHEGRCRRECRLLARLRRMNCRRKK